MLAKKTPEERAEHEVGKQLVDFYFDMIEDESLPQEVRDEARRKVRACASRDYSQTVRDVIGKAEN